MIERDGAAPALPDNWLELAATSPQKLLESCRYLTRHPGPAGTSVWYSVDMDLAQLVLAHAIAAGRRRADLLAGPRRTIQGRLLRAASIQFRWIGCDWVRVLVLRDRKGPLGVYAVDALADGNPTIDRQKLEHRGLERAPRSTVPH